MKIKILTLLVFASLMLAACAPVATPTEVAPPEAPEEEPMATEAEEMEEPTEAAVEEPTEVPVEEPTEVPSIEPTEEEAIEEPEQPSEIDAPKTLRLPNLEGATVVAVTGNDYTPLNFVDPLSGED